MSIIEHQRVGRGSAASDKAGAIRLVRRLVGNRFRRGQQMKHPRHLFPRCAWPPRAQDSLALGQDFGLHEQVTEGAMSQVGIQRRKHDFGVTRHLDVTATGRQVSERNPANLDVVFG